MCSSRLDVWDGPLRTAPTCNDVPCGNDHMPKVGASTTGKPPGNATILARYCKDLVPRSCDHGLLHRTSARLPRPCNDAESFLSSADSLTVELRLQESTALRPVLFRIQYEFVDLQQDGEAYGDGACYRRFVSRSREPLDLYPRSPQRVRSPKDVFLFGRGGASKLDCRYRFEGQRGERVKIIITRISTSGRACLTRVDESTGSAECSGDRSAALRLYENPWSDTPPIRRGCFCSQTTTGVAMPYTFISAASGAELRFSADRMRADDDGDTLMFEASYEFVRTPTCSANRRLMGASGQMRFRAPGRSPEDLNCAYHPWLVEPQHGHYLYIRIPGVRVGTADERSSNSTTTEAPLTLISSVHCRTANRILVHAGPKRVTVCPSQTGDRYVEVFSDGWPPHEHAPKTDPKSDKHALPTPSTEIVFEFHGEETGEYVVTWLELTRKPTVEPLAGFFGMDPVCPYRCPELDACINASLWCDGTPHCPSGRDEAFLLCSSLLLLPAEHAAMLAAFMLLLLLIFLLSCAWCRRRRRRRRSILESRLKSLSSSETAVFDEKEVIC